MSLLFAYNVQAVEELAAHANKPENWFDPQGDVSPGDRPAHVLVLGPVRMVYSVYRFHDGPRKAASFSLVGAKQGEDKLPSATICWILVESLGMDPRACRVSLETDPVAHVLLIQPCEGVSP